MKDAIQLWYKKKLLVSTLMLGCRKGGSYALTLHPLILIATKICRRQSQPSVMLAMRT